MTSTFDDEPEKHGLQRQDYSLAAVSGEGWVERLRVEPGLELFRGIHRFQRSNEWLALGEFVFDFSEPALVIQSAYGAAIRHREFHPQIEVLYQPGRDLFRLTDHLHLVAEVELVQHSEMHTLMLTQTMLVKWLGSTLTEALIERLGLHCSPPALQVLPMPSGVSALLRTALSTQLTGPFQKLLVQSRVLEYLSTLGGHLLARPEAPGVQRSTRLRLRELHDYLCHLDGKVPTLEELARRFGMSARRLNEHFARIYGMSIYTFIKEQRLNEAYSAIRHSDIPLKNIAIHLGYSHVNHFNTAFSKKFGLTPGSLRKCPANIEA